MTWIVTQRESFAGVADDATTAVTPISTYGNVADGPISACTLYGFQLSVNASNSAGHSAIVRVYGEAAATYLYHESEIDLSSSSDIQSVVMLTTAGTRRTAVVPLFDEPHFTIEDVGGGGSKTYTILFFIKPLE
jgi:hypothetical protein